MNSKVRFRCEKWWDRVVILLSAQLKATLLSLAFDRVTSVTSSHERSLGMVHDRYKITKPPHNSINKKCRMLKISAKNDSRKERNIYDLCTFFFYHLGNAVMNIKTRTIMHYIYYPHYDFFVYVFVRGLHNKICQCPQYFRSKKKEKAIKLRTQFKRCYIGRTYRCHPTSQSLTCIMKQNNYNNEASISIQSVLEASPAAWRFRSTDRHCPTTVEQNIPSLLEQINFNSTWESVLCLMRISGASRQTQHTVHWWM